MENLPTTKEQLIANFSTQLPRTLPDNEISIYRGNIISNEAIVKYSVKIRQAFPALPSDFYNILLEMVKDSNFTDERFRDSVFHVIKTCIYPSPTIANFLSYDKKYKVFTYDQMLEKLADSEMGAKFWDYYQKFKFSDRDYIVWIHIDDVNRYDIKEF